MGYSDIDYEILIESIDQRMKEFERLMVENPEEAKRIAMEDLMRTGIIDEQGNLKPPYNGVKVNPTDFTRGPGEWVEDYYAQVAKGLTPAERAEVWNLVPRSCSTCTNQSCRVETYEKIGLDEFGKPQGSSCIGWKNDHIIGEYKVLKLSKKND